VFENAHSIKIDAEPSKGLATILELHREDDAANDAAECHRTAVHLRVCLRRDPTARNRLSHARAEAATFGRAKQDFGLIMRDGVSFEESQHLRESDIAALCDKYAGQLRDRAGNDKRVLGASEIRCLLQGPGSSALPLRWKVAMQRLGTVEALESAPHIPGMAIVRTGADNALHCSVELSVSAEGGIGRRCERPGRAGSSCPPTIAPTSRSPSTLRRISTARRSNPEWAAFRTDVFVAQGAAQPGRA
jgi:hypothetical protein